MNDRRTWFEIGWKPLREGEGTKATPPRVLGSSPSPSGSPRMGSSDRSLSGEPDDKEPLDSAGPVTGQDGSGSGHARALDPSSDDPDGAGFTPSQQRTVVDSLDTLIVTLTKFVDAGRPMPVSFVSDLRSILGEVREIAARQPARHLSLIKGEAHGN